MQADYFLTADVARTLLRPSEQSFFKCADDQRSWSRVWTPALRNIAHGTVIDELWDTLLMRSYGYYSGSQPDDQNRMLARAPRMHLDTNQLRKSTLATHIDHQKREDTPYISFTNSPEVLQELADYRSKKSDQRIVVVDPRTRIELGLPVLHCGREMRHYDVPSRYSRDYWSNHFLCLWEVSPEEVVGIWAWDHLRSQPDWYNTVIMPAVERYRTTRDQESVQTAMDQQTSISHIPTDSTIPDPGQASNGLTWEDHEDEYSISSNSSDYVADDDGCYDSEDSYERVCEENWAGEVLNMYEDLRLD